MQWKKCTRLASQSRIWVVMRRGIAQFDLAIVGQMGFEGEHHAAATLDIGGIASQFAAERLGRLIEGIEIEGHVHMAVVVDPFRQNPGAMAIQRRRQIGGRDDVVHGRQSRRLTGTRQPSDFGWKSAAFRPVEPPAASR